MSNGCVPTSATVAKTVSDAISITVKVVLQVLDTYSFAWSGLIRDMKGRCPTGIIALTLPVAVSITETLLEFLLTTKHFVPSAVVTSSDGHTPPVGIVAITLNVVVSMTETVLPRLLAV
jgi:hypothetical protein